MLDHGELLKSVARTVHKEVTRFKAHEHQARQGVSSITRSPRVQDHLSLHKLTSTDTRSGTRACFASRPSHRVAS